MRFLRPISFLVLLLLLGGCAYFNTYYNARKYYEAGMEKKADDSRQSGESDFRESNTVSSKLLQFYPESRWVDDTILLIGLCYLELEQQHRALRKFDELESNFPDSKLIPRSRVYRARALLELNRLEECRRLLGELEALELKKEERRTWLEIHSELARQEENWGRLAQLQEQLLDYARSRPEKGRMNLEIGRSLHALGDFEGAVKAYSRVPRYRPGRLIEFEAHMAEIDDLIRLGRLERAENRLKKVRRNEHFHDLLESVALRDANLLRARGLQLEAMQAYSRLLEDYERTPAAGEAAYHLANLWLFAVDEVDSAVVYYRRSGQEDSRSAWADSASRRLDELEELDGVREEIHSLEEQLHRVSLRMDPDSARWLQLKESLPALKTALKRDTVKFVTQAELLLDSLPGAPGPPLSSALDSLAARADSIPDWAFRQAFEVRLEAADSLQEGSGESSAIERLENRLKDPGGRRNLFQSRRQREEAKADSLREAQIADSLLQIRLAEEGARLDSTLLAALLDSSQVEVEIDSMLLLQEQDSLHLLYFDRRFELAELQQLRLGHTRAADSLMSALQDEPGSPVRHSRLLFSHALLKEESLADSAAARALLNRLLQEYPSSAVANAARDRLGLPREPTQADSARVLLHQAERLWLEAYEALEAYYLYTELDSLYPESEAALVSLLARAEIQRDILGDRRRAVDHWRDAIRRFPESEAGLRLAAELGGDAREQDASQELEQEGLGDRALLEELTDESGRYILPAELQELEELVQHLRDAFQDTERLRLEEILH